MLSQIGLPVAKGPEEPALYFNFVMSSRLKPVIYLIHMTLLSIYNLNKPLLACSLHKQHSRIVSISNSRVCIQFSVIINDNLALMPTDATTME